MYSPAKGMLLRLMRVPPEPDPPQGSADSMRVFRAGRNFYTWSMLRWIVIQFCIAIPLVIALVVLTIAVREPRMPYLIRYLIGAVSWLFMLGFIAQLAVSFFLLRLNYELRWYIVTDRSLRIRFGVWFLEEMTMTFANIQQINIAQGPLQRVLGIANLEVTSAGGGAAAAAGHRRSHTGYFHGVNNASQIRDLILERLKRYRDSGLGDPDDHSSPHPEQTDAAAQELLHEARELRRALARS